MLARNRAVILLVSLITLLGIVLYFNLEPYEETISENWDIEAYQQPFLAAQKFKQQRAGDASVHSAYYTLFSNTETGVTPNADDAVLLAEAEMNISKAQTNLILDWVEQGGHLIVSVTHSYRVDGLVANTLLSELGVTTYEIEEGFDVYDSPTYFEIEGGKKLKVYFDTWFGLSFANESDLYYRTGPQSEDQQDISAISFAQREWGEGLISFMSNVELWHNHAITEHDNIDLFAVLTDNAEHLYIFDAKKAPAWYHLVYDFAPAFVWCGAIIICLTLWYCSARLGPVFSLISGERSKFREHIQASGHYYWRSQQQLRLLVELRQPVFTYCHQKIGAQDEASVTEYLSSRTAMPKQTVYQLLFNTTPLNEAQFTEVVRGLKQLRNQL